MLCVLCISFIFLGLHFRVGEKRIQSNVLLASHHRENKMTSLLFQFFFFFWKYCFVEEIVCFLVIISFFKNVSPEMTWDFLLYFGELS